jgi:hypothetical protein
MLELLGYLRANGFKTFIVSGGGIEFMRPWAERVYGVPPEQVVGSSGGTTLRTGADGKPVLFKDVGVEFVDDGPGKVLGVNGLLDAARSSPSAIPTAIRLSSMRERLHQIDGTLEVQSVPGFTIVKAPVPIEISDLRPCGYSSNMALARSATAFGCC